MCLVCTCDEKRKILNTQVAPGACPHCGGAIAASDVQSEWRFCFVPVFFKKRRTHTCTRCGKNLVIPH
uniref:Zinc-ribbon 15 domain-containing protein n=1 Tax=Picea sitchensis TaxID=3332 RepID=A9NPX8_PICSI|nr:unknown [Picea sitchensis]